MTSVFVMQGEQRLFEPDLEGALWVRGRTYKASAAADGFSYVPFLGSDAPRNMPVRFTLTQASLAGNALSLTPHATVRQVGNRFVLDRGAVEVRYDLGLEVEILTSFPSSGGLVRPAITKTSGHTEAPDSWCCAYLSDSSSPGLQDCIRTMDIDRNTVVLEDFRVGPVPHNATLDSFDIAAAESDGETNTAQLYFIT